MTRDLGPETVIDGRYRIGQRIGSGGMADVYLASDLQLDRQVAVKILHRRFAQDPEFVERFRREASNAAGLQHQHIVSVYDRGEWDGTYYIAMEYLQGRSLKQIINDYGPLDPALAADLASQILRAERFAHRRGVVHRDIKPHNVIVDDDGLATVTDFGIARAGASDMTQTGSIMGTAQYLSPEQAQGHEVGPQSDLYSTGVVLYEMATGRLPFDGESAVAIAMKQVGEAPPDPLSVNPSIPPALGAVILKALEKDPARRFADADAFIAALDAAQQGIFPDTPALPPPPRALSAPDQTQAGMTGATLAAATAGGAGNGAGEGDGSDGPGRRWWIFVAAGVVAAAAVIALLLILRAPQVPVPAVVGSQEAEAQTILKKAGFESESVRKQSDSPKGQVIAQDPAGGDRAGKGSTVTITVSDGPKSLPVPSVSGLTASQAKRRLENAGFNVRERKKPDDRVPVGDAVETLPPEGTPTPLGSTVTLIVSTGKEKVEVPSVVGQSSEDAQATLRGAGFGVSVTQKESSDAAPGTVIGQSPAGGTEADRGSTVAIEVAKKATTATVPNTVGTDEATAIDRIQGAGFRVSIERVPVSDEADEGTVVDQNPTGGKAPAGSTVTISVGRYVPPPGG
ncbi:MAG: Stk1 family PASTA domain-containing Ser/Thr kinase [Acidobacteria bacterium]|nr:Stk1 family PASTA domain-containing Ser/Thr kinase [Acidobacteriota bacterium]